MPVAAHGHFASNGKKLNTPCVAPLMGILHAAPLPHLDFHRSPRPPPSFADLEILGPLTEGGRAWRY
jgi:hypothetical protein